MYFIDTQNVKRLRIYNNKNRGNTTYIFLIVTFELKFNDNFNF